MRCARPGGKGNWMNSDLYKKCGFEISQMWIWDVYMQSIIPQQLARDPSHGRAKIAAIYVKVFVFDDDNLSSSPVGGANMGPCAPQVTAHGPGVQGAHHWGSPAPDRQWPGTNAPAVIRRGDGKPGADTTFSWSNDGGRTCKKSMSVALLYTGVPARVQKSGFKFPQHRTREWGHWCPSSIL